jgi:hypothetical protein
MIGPAALDTNVVNPPVAPTARMTLGVAAGKDRDDYAEYNPLE